MPSPVPAVVFRAVLPCSALLAAGCNSLTVRPDQALHLVCADSDGGFCGPAETSGDPPRNHADHARRIAQAYEASGCSRVMLVIHGGLVDRSTGVEEALASMAAMATDPAMADVFPIFVVWETGIRRSYFDHLFYVRNGRVDRTRAAFSFPFVLLADFGRALTRWPITLWTQAENFGSYYLVPEPARVPPNWDHTAWLDRAGEDDPWWTTLLDLGCELVPGALRLATSPLLDGAGVPAYMNMRRRARVLFVRDHDHDADVFQWSGAIPALMESLAATKRRPAFTIVAHSMGTLVANELLQRYGHRQWTRELKMRLQQSPDVQKTDLARLVGEEPLAIDRIVYMGAACSVREFAGAVLPHLRSNEQARFYNLCLHPYDEQDDRYAVGTLPHGSLLEWIDDYITEQESPLDRTLGKWDNAMDGLPLMDFVDHGVRHRLRTRGFPRSGDGPHDHGDFNDPRHRFWHESFWWQPPPAGR